MTVTINAHQLGRLIDKTISHIGSESHESLHGIRLDIDARYLYAVATDRFTMVAARYGLNHDEKDQEPWARTIPADYLPSLREWINSMKGAEYITIEAGDNRIVFDSPQTTYSAAVSSSLEFPDWRGLLRSITEQTVDEVPFPAIDSRMLKRFSDTDDILRVRVTAEQKPVLVFGEDFIGAQMPCRYTGVGAVKEETFETVSSLWLWTLAAGAKGVDMATDIPESEPTRHFEAPKDVRQTGADLLRGVLSSLESSMEADWDEDRDAWLAHIASGVADWRAYRYLDALYQVDPRAAQEVVADTAEQLDSGEIGEWAWDAAEEAGHKPAQWKEERDEAVAKQMAEEPAMWARRLARGLNHAKSAGINFRIDDNPFVTYDAEAEEWKATHPRPAETPA
ncbi:hypothetical protein GCM10009837_06710 [Streptomyces durmitorensis]|uniref:DNA polymerase III beta sliding clamp central domain-containing protein n=1 Tax=Streptomyces durmitorensis TaxID=319947 RepID=A0ABY4PNB2_9ACTN|nr:hypothetical protein [Streptomyces durmitorensis]UQT54433.1 hypothetical protein M4V62_04625 [Streptomyces durmitorensis]